MKAVRITVWLESTCPTRTITMKCIDASQCRSEVPNPCPHHSPGVGENSTLSSVGHQWKWPSTQTTHGVCWLTSLNMWMIYSKLGLVDGCWWCNLLLLLVAKLQLVCFWYLTPTLDYIVLLNYIVHQSTTQELHPACIIMWVYAWT